MNILFGLIVSLERKDHGGLVKDEAGNIYKFFYKDLRAFVVKDGTIAFEKSTKVLLKEGLPVAFLIKSRQSRDKLYPRVHRMVVIGSVLF